MRLDGFGLGFIGISAEFIAGRVSGLFVLALI